MSSAAALPLWYTSAWMLVTPGDAGASASSTSSTGPQIWTWQYAGVPTSRAVGFLAASVVRRSSACRAHGGSAVQIGSTPRWSDVVGVSKTGITSPTWGTDVSSTTANEASTRVPPTLVTTV